MVIVFKLDYNKQVLWRRSTKYPRNKTGVENRKWCPWETDGSPCLPASPITPFLHPLAEAKMTFPDTHRTLLRFLRSAARNMSASVNNEISVLKLNL